MLLTKFAACFSVKTGDVEDAPAPDHLHKFDVIEKDGGVYVKGSEDNIKAGRRKPSYKVKSAGQEKVVIVGGYGSFKYFRKHY